MGRIELLCLGVLDFRPANNGECKKQRRHGSCISRASSDWQALASLLCSTAFTRYSALLDKTAPSSCWQEKTDPNSKGDRAGVLGRLRWDGVWGWSDRHCEAAPITHPRLYTIA